MGSHEDKLISIVSDCKKAVSVMTRESHPSRLVNKIEEVPTWLGSHEDKLISVVSDCRKVVSVMTRESQPSRLVNKIEDRLHTGSADR